MIKYKVSKKPQIMFVGINPHYGSYNRGIPFSNNKMFWYLLNRAGIIDEDINELRQDRSLKRIYENRFLPVYNLNFTNIIIRPSHDVMQLKNGEEEKGKKRISKAIRECRPKVICFIGKVTYAKFIGSNAFEFGWQKSINGSKVYVMHFPIRGRASIRVRELRRIKRVAEDGKK